MTGLLCDTFNTVSIFTRLHSHLIVVPWALSAMQSALIGLRRVLAGIGRELISQCLVSIGNRPVIVGIRRIITGIDPNRHGR